MDLLTSQIIFTHETLVLLRRLLLIVRRKTVERRSIGSERAPAGTERNANVYWLPGADPAERRARHWSRRPTGVKHCAAVSIRGPTIIINKCLHDGSMN